MCTADQLTTAAGTVGIQCSRKKPIETGNEASSAYFDIIGSDISTQWSVVHVSPVFSTELADNFIRAELAS